MTELLLSEELLLLALDGESGANRAQWSLDAALAGAMLLDLVAAGALRERDGALVAEPGQAPGHPALAQALAAIEADQRPRDPEHWVRTLPRRVKPITRHVAAPLVERGILTEEHRRLLGVLDRTRYVEADPAPERELRERLARALLDEGGGAVDARTATLVALLRPVELVKRVVPRDRRREAERRAKEIAESNAIESAVDDAIRSVQAAIVASTAAVAASTAATSAAGG